MAAGQSGESLRDHLHAKNLQFCKSCNFIQTERTQAGSLQKFAGNSAQEMQISCDNLTLGLATGLPQGRCLS
jgi:hypothetical protein